jgi:hypothetical protein
MLSVKRLSLAFEPAWAEVRAGRRRSVSGTHRQALRGPTDEAVLVEQL